MGQLAVMIGEAASKRVIWEHAKAESAPDIFMRSKAHRDAESAVKEMCEVVIEAYADHIRRGIPLG